MPAAAFRQPQSAVEQRAMPRTLVAYEAVAHVEALPTRGSLAPRRSDGDRLVLVVATGGELGEVAPGVLDDGEELATRRALEQARAGEALGVARIEFLGYRDSGMAGEETNSAPGAFAAAPVAEAAERLARILREEDAEVLTIYDENGNYGHPDHIQVHHVGIAAAELAGTPRVYEATVNRDHLLDLMRSRAEEMPDIEGAPDPDDFDIGVSADRITTTVDVGEYVAQKRAAMRAHASQIPEDSFFLQLPDEAFAAAFGQEWFIRRRPEVDGEETWLFPSPAKN
jgi:LmbE family N-acetylglucosaminyl deacetylase